MQAECHPTNSDEGNQWWADWTDASSLCHMNSQRPSNFHWSTLCLKTQDTLYLLAHKLGKFRPSVVFSRRHVKCAHKRSYCGSFCVHWRVKVSKIKSFLSHIGLWVTADVRLHSPQMEQYEGQSKHWPRPGKSPTSPILSPSRWTNSLLGEGTLDASCTTSVDRHHQDKRTNLMLFNVAHRRHHHHHQNVTIRFILYSDGVTRILAFTTSTCSSAIAERKRRTSHFDSQNCKVEFLSHPLGSLGET